MLVSPPSNSEQSTEFSTRVAEATLSDLKRSIDEVMLELNDLDTYQVLMHPDTSPRQINVTLRELYREVCLYQPDVIEATIAVIGQFPRSLDARRVRTMLIHQAEEWDHGEMAIRDFVSTGAAEADVRDQLMTPTFATAAFWRMLAHKRLPFAYLGALYLFEGLTPLVTGLVKNHLAARRLTPDGFEYVEFHATEDIKHAKIVDYLILEAVQQYPDRADEVRFGFNAFRQVYPFPGWAAAGVRARLAFSPSPGVVR